MLLRSTTVDSKIASIISIRWHTIDQVDKAPLLACLIRFCPETLSLEAFSACGIELPPAVAVAVPKRQTEFFFGRLAARLALFALTGQTLNVQIGPDRQPIWPHGVIGSISHDNQFAAAIVLEKGPSSGVGIDVEQIASAEAAQALCETVISRREFEYLRTLTMGLSMPALLTLVFSAKESLFKGAYGEVGRYFDFTAAEILSLDVTRRNITLILRENLSPHFFEGMRLDVHYDLIQENTVLTVFRW